MSNPTPRKRDQMKIRRELVAKYRLSGMTELQIKTMLEKKHDIEVDRSTISNDLKALRKEWQEETMGDTKQLQSESLMKLEQLELEAWSLFNQAKNKENKTGKAGGNTAGYWHGQIIKTIDEKMKIIGVPKQEAPKQTVNVFGQIPDNVKLEDLTDEQLLMIITAENGPENGSTGTS